MSKHQKIIYFDNNSTTQTHPFIYDAIKPFVVENYGNASSSHPLGKRSRNIIDESRKSIAKHLNCATDNIYFCSSSTEANNLILQGIASYYKYNLHMITSTVEHPAVYNTMKWLSSQYPKVTVTFLPVDRYGCVEPHVLKTAIKPGKTKVFSVILANNEIGTIQDIKALKAVLSNDIILHVDATQMAGKYPIDTTKYGIDALTCSGHKIHAMKGVACFYLNDRCGVKACVFGGSQERSLRPGTEAPALIYSLKLAFDYNLNKKHQLATINKLNNMVMYLVKNINKVTPIRLNGHPERRLPNNISITFLDESIDGTRLINELYKRGICCSVGSACSLMKKSRILDAIGISDAHSKRTLRIGLSEYNTIDECITFVNTIKLLS